MAGLLDFDISKLEQSPLLNIGLGIMANNTGHGGAFAPAFGGGVQQGLQQANLFKQQQLMNNYHKQQFDMSKLQYDQQQSEKQTQEDFHKSFDAKFPQYAGYSRVDAKGAMKLVNPTIDTNVPDPYYQFLATPNGYVAGNARTGKVEEVMLPNGQRVIKSSDSPQLQGSIAGAKTQASAQWKPNNMIDGVISTDAQVSKMANGGIPNYNGNTPYPMTWNGQPMGAPNTTITDAIEGDGNIQLRNPATPNVGIKVPTKAEEAANKKTAELVATDKANTLIGLPQAITQAENTLRLVDELVGSSDGKTKPHKGLSTATGLSSKLDPRNYIAGTDATDFNTRLDQLKGTQFMDAYQGLKGGGQITEVEGKKATDAIARMNKATSEEEFIKASREYQTVIRGAVNRAKMKAGLTNNAINEKVNSSQQIRTVDW